REGTPSRSDGEGEGPPASVFEMPSPACLPPGTKCPGGGRGIKVPPLGEVSLRSLLRRLAHNRFGRPDLVLAPDGLEDGREGRPRDTAPGPLLDIQLAVGPDQLALADGVAGAASDLHALEDVEINLLVMGLGGDGAGRRGVPDHDVGIGADAD